jgi:MATE family multidrug resistance protein
MFNFIGIGTQTEIAQLLGMGKSSKAKEVLTIALLLSSVFGILILLIFGPASSWIAGLLGASGEVLSNAVPYMQIRFIGAPAVLLTLAIFGALRGLHDMRTPLWIALGVNGLNILLDWVLIFGKGPFPALGIQGSALASTLSQWIGAIAGIMMVVRKIGLSSSFQLQDAVKILQVGGDMFIRTGILNIFLAYTTRVANVISPDAGAAHQAIRQAWVFTALALDAYAATVQSLVGFFIGQGSISQVKRVVQVALTWSLGTGFALTGMMWWGQDLVISLLVPASAVNTFIPGWMVSTLSQPLNAMAFLTDGVHWGTGDFRYLRNAMLVASIIGIVGLRFIETSQYKSLFWVWILIGIWIILRGLFGTLRIWPGIGRSPFKSKTQ